LGQVAVNLGYATPEQVEAALQEQKHRAESDQWMRIGMLLCEMGVLTPTQLFRVLSRTESSLNVPNEDAIRLAAHLRSAAVSDVRVILITSAACGEGKSVIASQLATALALMGRDEVLLVDGNLRRPTMHSQFSLKRGPGLSELVGRGGDFASFIQKTDIPRLSLLSSGEAVDDFIYLLMDERCGGQLSQLRQTFPIIIIDTAAIMVYPDAALMVPHADAVLLVVSAGERRKNEVLEMKRLVEGMQVRILGAMLSERG